MPSDYRLVSPTVDCWVDLDDGQRCFGEIRAWRRDDQGEWEADVRYSIQEGGYPALRVDWIPARRVTRHVDDDPVADSSG